MGVGNGDAPTHTRKILFLTNAESGQANTILAMALEAVTRPHVQVHIASFPALKRRVERLSPKLNFHALDGEDMTELMTARGITDVNIAHLPTRMSFAAYGRNLALIVTVWDGERAFCSFFRHGVAYLMVSSLGSAYMRLYESIVKLIASGKILPTRRHYVMLFGGMTAYLC